MPNVAKSAFYGPVFFIHLHGLYRGAGVYNKKRNLQKVYAYFDNVDKFISYLALQLRYKDNTYSAGSCRKIVVAYCENHRELTNTLCDLMFFRLCIIV